MGVEYFKNIVKYNTELYNKLLKELKSVKGNNIEDQMLKQTLIGGINESALIISEAVKAAKEVFEETIKLEDDVQTTVDSLKQTFYLKSGQIYNTMGPSLDEMKEVFKQRFKDDQK